MRLLGQACAVWDLQAEMKSVQSREDKRSFLRIQRADARAKKGNKAERTNHFVEPASQPEDSPLVWRLEQGFNAATRVGRGAKHHCRHFRRKFFSPSWVMLFKRLRICLVIAARWAKDANFTSPTLRAHMPKRPDLFLRPILGFAPEL